MEDPPATVASPALAMWEVSEDSALFPPQRREIYTPPPQKAEKEGLQVESTNKATGSLRRKMFANSRDATSREDNKLQRERTPRAPDSAESLAEMLRRGMVDHQLGLSVNLVLLVGLSWLLFPTLRERMEAFSSLSYRTSSGVYGQGLKDLQLVLSFVVVFTATRAFALDYILTPVATFLGIRRQKPKVRFAEQSYLLLYYCIYWSWGLYIFIKDTPSSLPSSKLDVEGLLISLIRGYPRLYIDTGMKLYYLSQLAFWIQQIVVIHLEEKRKDHYQMLTHHFVTVALLLTSYGDRQCRIGNAVLVCMDVVDLIFPLAKILRYIGWQAACDAAFALFVVLWLAARHFAYLTICWALYYYTDRNAMHYGTYSLQNTTINKVISGARLSTDGGQEVFSNIFQPFVNPNAEVVAYNQRMHWVFLGLLLGLQCITLMWFVMICRVVARVLRGEGADDSRSDDEGEEDEAVEQNLAPVQPSAPFSALEEKRFIEVESTAEDLSFEHVKRSGSASGSKRRVKGISSGLNLGDRKDILNRIGCLSEEQLSREREKREGSEGPRPGSGSGR